MKYWKALTLIALILVYIIATKSLNPKLEIEESIEINAPDEKIWDIISNFGTYPDWNTYIKYIEGDLKPGKSLYVETENMNANHAKYHAIVTKVVENRELSWEGRLLMSGIYDSERSFVITSLSESRSIFTFRGNYTGLLVPLFRALVRKGEASDYKRMNKALKVRAEKLSDQAGQG
ncbi:MAG: SRPBCC domain-containing protein [Desulfobacteraceae bacterium]|nr:SRPBCC domain-containing protein [Desulfobacteraceae bacterium]